jgi:hypothetical protein
MSRCGLYLSGPRQRPVTDFREYDNELSGSIERGKFIN